MPPRKPKKDILVMVANIGCNSEEQANSDETFLSKSKLAMRHLIQKKIFFNPNDEIGIITMGDNETNNCENIENVKEYYPNLLIPHWDLIKYVEQLKATDKPCNWVEALQAALSYINKEIINPAKIFIVMFNNFKENFEEINQYDPDVIVGDLKKVENLFMVFVGHNSLTSEKEKESFTENEKYLLNICEEAGAQYEQIDHFIDEIKFYNPPQKTIAMPWKCQLELGDLCIPCCTYLRTTGPTKIDCRWHQRIDKDFDSTNGSSTTPSSDVTSIENTEKLGKQKVTMDADRNEIFEENSIHAYQFGGKYIPATAEDEKAMKMSNCTKGLKIYGFVPTNQVKLEYWSGTGARIIVPESEESESAFYNLLQAMVEMNLVAIVRKVYSVNSSPRMGFLFPKNTDEQIWCLVHLEMSFADEIRIAAKELIPPLKSFMSEKKIQLIDEYIDSMTINEEEVDRFAPGTLADLQLQHQINVFAERILHPDQPVAKTPKYITDYLQLYEKKKNVKDICEKLCQEMDLKIKEEEKGELKGKKKKDIEKNGASTSNQSDANKVCQSNQPTDANSKDMEQSQLFEPEDINESDDDDMLDDL